MAFDIGKTQFFILLLVMAVVAWTLVTPVLRGVMWLAAAIPLRSDAGTPSERREQRLRENKGLFWPRLRYAAGLSLLTIPLFMANRVVLSAILAATHYGWNKDVYTNVRWGLSVLELCLMAVAADLHLRTSLRRQGEP